MGAEKKYTIIQLREKMRSAMADDFSKKNTITDAIDWVCNGLDDAVSEVDDPKALKGMINTLASYLSYQFNKLAEEGDENGY